MRSAIPPNSRQYLRHIGTVAGSECSLYHSSSALMVSKRFPSAMANFPSLRVCICTWASPAERRMINQSAFSHTIRTRSLGSDDSHIRVTRALTKEIAWSTVLQHQCLGGSSVDSVNEVRGYV